MSEEGIEFNVRLQQALVLLETKGLGKNNYAPPLFRLLWKFGVKAPPPHMAGFAFQRPADGDILRRVLGFVDVAAAVGQAGHADGTGRGRGTLRRHAVWPDDGVVHAL